MILRSENSRKKCFLFSDISNGSPRRGKTPHLQMTVTPVNLRIVKFIRPYGLSLSFVPNTILHSFRSCTSCSEAGNWHDTQSHRKSHFGGQGTLLCQIKEDTLPYIRSLLITQNNMPECDQRAGEIT